MKVAAKAALCVLSIGRESRKRNRNQNLAKTWGKINKDATKIIAKMVYETGRNYEEWKHLLNEKANKKTSKK